MAHISEHRKIHLIGIGGCSMNGLAMILKARGYVVQGSDKAESPFTRRLVELGIPVELSQREENLGEADLVIYSAAIKSDNPERAAARARGIPEMERSVALGELSDGYENVVGVAGCHGKTTVTSMLALISELDGLDATVHVGGFVDFLQGGTRVGSHALFITEACEYVESFLTLHPTIALINNIDDDHLDYYGDIEHIVAAFEKFLALLPEGGLFIGCSDDFRVKRLLESYDGPTLSYGMKDADYTPAHIVYGDNGAPEFDLLYRGEKLAHFAMQAPGEHIVIDAMAAAAVALSLGAPVAVIERALGQFHNTRRRFEFYGEREGIRFYHDYAHHPAEIRAALDAASRVKHEKLYCVFQCNSYTRAKTLFCKDSDCFKNADAVLVPDIYPGREIDDGSVHARDMVKSINAVTGNAVYLENFERIRGYLDEHAQSGDLVITLGSGDVYMQTKKLL